MFGFGGFGNIFPEMPGRIFSETYRCYSVTVLGERESVEKGGKIIMPPTALDQLTRLHIQYPMLFKLKNQRANRETHCGVLEFVADEGRIYMPYWMMQNLALDEGSLVDIQNVSLSVATFAKFQPQSVDFLDITNPKAVLENALRSFACLTTGDVVAIVYNDKRYELCVLETKPGNAVSIIECDMNVDFAPPIGYQEPTRQDNIRNHTEDEEDMDVTDSDHTDNTFRAFCGEGNRLDGKRRSLTQSASQTERTIVKRGVPNYNHKPGTITFIRSTKPSVGNGNPDNKDNTEFEAFSGEGQTLKKKGRK